MKQVNNIKMHSVKYNFLMNIILKMSSFIFPLITFPYISRVLGPAGNGKVAFATSVVYYFSIFAALGIPTYGIRKCAQCRDDKQKLAKTVHELLILGSILTVIAYIVLVICIFSIPKLRDNANIIFITSATLILTNVGVEWFYQAIEQYDYITIRNLLFKFISIILMFIFVKQPEDYVIYAGIQVIGTVGSNILNLIKLRKYIPVKIDGKYNLKQHLKPSMMFFLMTIAATIYTNLDTVMLGFMENSIQVGYYNAAVKMKNILTSVVSALGAVLLPRVSYYIEKGMYEEYRKTLNKSIKVVLLISLPLMLYCMIEARDVLLFLSGKQYLPALSAMVVIMPTILLIGISNVTGMQILVPLGLEKYTIVSTVIGAIVDVILNSLLIPQYGAMGAAVGTLIAEVSVLIVQIYFLRKIKYVNIINKDWIKIILATMIALIGMRVIDKIVFIDIILLRLFYTSAIFFGIYILALIVLKEEIVQEQGISIIKKSFFKDKEE